MDRKNKMESMPMNKLVINMSLPLIVSLLVQSLYNIVDSIFVAKLSEEALTAVSLAYPVNMLIIAFSVGTSVGMNALLSKTLGAKETEKVTKIAATGMVLALLGASVFALAGLFFAKNLAETFTSVESTARLCGDYLRICMVFCFGNFVETMAQSADESDFGSHYDLRTAWVSGNGNSGGRHCNGDRTMDRCGCGTGVELFLQPGCEVEPEGLSI